VARGAGQAAGSAGGAAADDVVARGDGRGVVFEGGQAAGVRLFRGADGVGGGQEGDQRAAAGQSEDAGYRGDYA
jgi:hypothetical protein